MVLRWTAPSDSGGSVQAMCPGRARPGYVGTRASGCLSWSLWWRWCTSRASGRLRFGGTRSPASMRRPDHSRICCGCSRTRTRPTGSTTCCCTSGPCCRPRRPGSARCPGFSRSPPWRSWQSWHAGAWASSPQPRSCASCSGTPSSPTTPGRPDSTRWPSPSCAGRRWRCWASRTASVLDDGPCTPCSQSAPSTRASSRSARDTAREPGN